MTRIKGFTLIELIATMILVSLISVVVGRILFQGYRTFIVTKDISNADWQSYSVLQRLSNDIHRIRSSSDISTMTVSSLGFTDVSGSSVLYQFSGNVLSRNGQTLATGISDFGLIYRDKNGNITGTATAVRYIQIAVTATQGGIPASYVTLLGTRGVA